MEAYLVVALIGIGLLLAELLLPTGGFSPSSARSAWSSAGSWRRPPIPARPSPTSPGRP